MLSETNLIYMQDAYQRELDTEVIGVSQDEKGAPVLILDATIFYPQGGGQPSDQGIITAPNGSARVLHARYQHGVVLHEVELQGSIQEGDAVHCALDWERRYHNMRVHSAGHVVHDALMRLPVSGIAPQRGNHGESPYNEYSGELSPDILPELERMTNEMIRSALPTHTRMVDLEELKRLSRFVPAGLPADKPLRIFWIEGCDPMPDGGTQVASTAEVGAVKIVKISAKKGITRIRYEVEDPQP